MKLSPRHLVWVNLVLLALVAYWGASTTSTAIAAKLTPPPDIRVSPPPPPLPKEPHRPATYYAAIHVRDIFNSTKPEEEKPKEPPPKPTELKLKLWGVSVHADGASSRCIIEDLTTHKQDVYAMNETVPGNATVKQIEWDRVILDRGGQDEILDLATPQGGPAVKAAAVAASPTSSDPHIHQVSEFQYNIDRSEVDAALDNMNQLFTQIRAVPHFEGGKSTGFRLFAIRQDSLFDKIGLKNGDIIQQINGIDLNDPSKAMALFGELRNENALNVQILRNKESKTMSYQFTNNQ